MKTNNHHAAIPFWQAKKLSELNRQEWEQLCDGCAICCLCKYEMERSNYLYYTSICCQYLDISQCRCQDYPQRNTMVPSCVTITAENILEFYWLPPTCAYVRLAKGQDLPKWHHLISHDPNLVHRLGVSIRNNVIPETDIDPENWDNYIIGRIKKKT
jgi:uncharacterized cysteine cluster protein YcgN (CxxCxxCC family)